MPTHDGIGLHDHQGGAPIPPRVGEQRPKQSISVTELGTLHGAPEYGQLLTECQILEYDRSVSTADQREGSEHDDERSQHEPSCFAVTHRINRRGRRSDSGERQDGRSVVFWAQGDSTLKRIAVSGGAATTVCPAAISFGVSWGADGIVFAQNG
jgi:hypothetical protein